MIGRNSLRIGISKVVRREIILSWRMLRTAAYHRTVSEYLYTGSEIFLTPTLKYINVVNPIEVREYMDVSF